MEFSRQEYYSGLSFCSLGYLPDPGIEPGSPALQGDCLLSEPPGKPSLCNTTAGLNKSWGFAMLLTNAQGIGNNASNSFLDYAPDLLNQNLCGLGICISKSRLGMCEHLYRIFHPTPISVISLSFIF